MNGARHENSPARRLKMAAALLGLFVAFFSGPFCAPLHAMPPVERTVLPNGLVLLAFEEHSLPVVTLELMVNAGSWRDPHGMEGLANLTVKSLLLGAGALSSKDFNGRLDFIGAEIETGCEKDYATIRMRMLKKDLDAGFGLFMDLITEASFPEEEVRKEIGKVEAAIESLEDQPGELAKNAFDQALFLDSPYAHQTEGTRESAGKISTDAIRRFYTAFYRPNNAILAFGGDVSADEVRAKIVPRLAQWARADIPEAPFAAKFADGKAEVKIRKKISQANIVIGGPGIARANPDYYALSVLNYIFGSGDLSSRLMIEIREKRGLAYSVESAVVARKHPGAFQVELQTKNATAQEAVALVIEEMRRIQKEPVSEAELKNAKLYLIGSFPQRYSTQQRLASFLAQVENFGLGLDYPAKYPSLIGSITAQDVQRTATRYLKPDGSVLVVVGDVAGD
jgi:zinc protease